MMPLLPLQPIYRRYLWGGRRFAAALGRDLPPGDDFAESWELVDRGADQTLVAAGPLAGTPLGDLVRTRGRELAGRHADRVPFPLLFKFLDARRDLSVQVHPDDVRAARLTPPDLGKTEAWYVVDADPGSRIYAGLAPGVDQTTLADALRAGRCDEVLHAFTPRVGDCIFIPAGTVHAIGAGLLVAEIQQSSDVTYRLHDWNRLGPDGRPRALHVEQGLEAVTRFGPVLPVAAEAVAAPAWRRLVTCSQFLLDEIRPTGRFEVGGDETWHFLSVIRGGVESDPRHGLATVPPGGCLLLPACRGRETFTPTTNGETVLLHVQLP